MPLELQPATEADAQRAAKIEEAAYAPNPFNRILFPGGSPPDAVKLRAEGLATSFREDKRRRWLKVIDTKLEGDEQMIAFAEWHIYADQGPGFIPMRSFGPTANDEACEMLFGGLARTRARLMGDKPHVFLKLLHTDPSQQGRGAGAMLVRWGLEEARKLNLPAYLEASEAGHKLYTNCGFKDVELQSLDFSKWGATERHNNWAMIWEPSN